MIQDKKRGGENMFMSLKNERGGLDWLYCCHDVVTIKQKKSLRKKWGCVSCLEGNFVFVELCKTPFPPLLRFILHR